MGVPKKGHVHVSVECTHPLQCQNTKTVTVWLMRTSQSTRIYVRMYEHTTIVSHENEICQWFLSGLMISNAHVNRHAYLSRHYYCCIILLWTVAHRTQLVAKRRPIHYGSPWDTVHTHAHAICAPRCSRCQGGEITVYASTKLTE
jgi:hypothetical protein